MTQRYQIYVKDKGNVVFDAPNWTLAYQYASEHFRNTIGMVVPENYQISDRVWNKAVKVLVETFIYDARQIAQVSNRYGDSSEYKDEVLWNSDMFYEAQLPHFGKRDRVTIIPVKDREDPTLFQAHKSMGYYSFAHIVNDTFFNAGAKWFNLGEYPYKDDLYRELEDQMEKVLEKEGIVASLCLEEDWEYNPPSFYISSSFNVDLPEKTWLVLKPENQEWKAINFFIAVDREIALEEAARYSDIPSYRLRAFELAAEETEVL